jgi:hypothetical protein
MQKQRITQRIKLMVDDFIEQHVELQILQGY